MSNTTYKVLVEFKKEFQENIENTQQKFKNLNETNKNLKDVLNKQNSDITLLRAELQNAIESIKRKSEIIVAIQNK